MDGMDGQGPGKPKQAPLTAADFAAPDQAPITAADFGPDFSNLSPEMATEHRRRAALVNDDGSPYLWDVAKETGRALWAPIKQMAGTMRKLGPQAPRHGAGLWFGEMGGAPHEPMDPAAVREAGSELGGMLAAPVTMPIAFAKGVAHAVGHPGDVTPEETGQTVAAGLGTLGTLGMFGAKAPLTPADFDVSIAKGVTQGIRESVMRAATEE